MDNIFHFHFLESTFDLALLAALKLVTLVLLYTFLEDATMAVIESPYDQKVLRRKKSLHVAIFILTFTYLVYSLVKGGRILNASLNDPTYTKMHTTCNILIISTIVFGSLEQLLALCSIQAMENLLVIRILHRINENNQEVDSEGNIVKSSNLHRLSKLAKNVSDRFRYICSFLSSEEIPINAVMLKTVCQKIIERKNYRLCSILTQILEYVVSVVLSNTAGK